MKKIPGWLIAGLLVVLSSCASGEEPEAPPAGEAFSLRIEFGHGDEQTWEGSVSTQAALVSATKPWQFRDQDRLSLNTFQLRTIHARTQEREAKGLILNGCLGSHESR